MTNYPCKVASLQSQFPLTLADIFSLVVFRDVKHTSKYFTDQAFSQSDTSLVRPLAPRSGAFLQSYTANWLGELTDCTTDRLYNHLYLYGVFIGTTASYIKELILYIMQHTKAYLNVCIDNYVNTADLIVTQICMLVRTITTVSFVYNRHFHMGA